MAVAHHLTYADLLDIPGERRELLGRELHVAASPSKRHQRVVRELGAYFLGAMRAGLGEVWYAPFDVYLDLHNVVQPDLLFVRAGREAIVQENKVVGVPDLAVEILSPSTAAVDVGRAPKGSSAPTSALAFPTIGSSIPMSSGSTSTRRMPLRRAATRANRCATDRRTYSTPRSFPDFRCA
jgi:hypothetical protein